MAEFDLTTTSLQVSSTALLESLLEKLKKENAEKFLFFKTDDEPVTALKSDSLMLGGDYYKEFPNLAKFVDSKIIIILRLLRQMKSTSRVLMR